MWTPAGLCFSKAALLGITALVLAASAVAAPAVKVIYFTASWCSNCRILTPRLDAAMAVFEASEAELVKIDLSNMSGGTIDERLAMVKTAEDTLLAHHARYLWDWYGGYTGIAAIISADNGEPLSCIMRLMTADEIVARIADGIHATHMRPPGGRKPEGPDCPAPTRLDRNEVR